MTRGLVLALGLGLMAQPALAAPVISDYVVFGTTSVTIGQGTGSPVNAPVGSGGSVSIQQNGNVGDTAGTIVLSGGGAYTGGQNGEYVGDIIFSGSVSLGQNSTVSGSVHSGGSVTTNSGVAVSGDVIAAGNIGLGNGSQIGGDVHAGGNVTAGNNSSITGTASAGGTVSLGNNATAGAIVNGAAAPVPLAPPSVALPEANLFTAGGLNQTVGNNGSLSLLADTYGALQVGNNGEVSLSSGEYFFDSMTFGNNGTLELDLTLGAIVINIVGNLSTNSGFEIVLIGGDASDVLFEVHGNASIGQNADWFGTLFAADGTVTFNANAEITGAIYGDIVNIGQNSRFSYARSNILFPADNGNGPDPAQVAEPAALGFLGMGLIGLALYRGRHRA